jgi:hypothetical protein
MDLDRIPLLLELEPNSTPFHSPSPPIMDLDRKPFPLERNIEKLVQDTAIRQDQDQCSDTIILIQAEAKSDGSDNLLPEEQISFPLENSVKIEPVSAITDHMNAQVISPVQMKRKYSFSLVFSPYRQFTYSGEHEGYFSDVPNEILLVIFSYFQSARDLLSVACVTKRWNFHSNNSDLWQSLYKLHWEKPNISLNTISWKNLFMKKNLEFLLSQISLDRSYARSKKPITANIITEVPRAKWRKPEKKKIKNDHSKKHERKRKRQGFQDEAIQDFLEERKQFFDSFCTTCLATTPMKNDSLTFSRR